MKNFNKEDNLIEIIFEDDFIVVINKKNGLLSHCNQIKNSISVVSLLKEYDIKLYKAEDSYDVFDKDIMRGRITVATSKTTILKKCIDKLIEEENKEYLAKRGVN